MAQAALTGPALPYARAGTCWCYNESGVLVSAAANEPPFDHWPATGAPRGLQIEPTRTNGVPNNTMVGAATGTPGTKPTGWFTVPRGTTQTVVGFGTINGINYIDLKFTGTPDNDLIISPMGTTAVDALTGEDWLASAYLAIVGGDFTNIDSVELAQSERTEAGPEVKTHNGADLVGVLTSTMQRIEHARTLDGGGTTAHITSPILINWTSGAIDITLRIGLPQEEKGTFATTPIKTVNAGAVTRSAPVVVMTDMSPFNRPQGTFRVGFSRPIYTGLYPVVALQVDTVANSGIELNTQADGVNARVDFARASGQDTLDTGLLPVVDQQHKLAFAYAADDLQSAGDGDLGGSDGDTQGELYTAGTNVFNVGFGEGQSVVDPLHLQFIDFWQAREDESFLQNITG